jgi:3-hydroxyacyl-CoA dehydrogenase/enoyl-CoA hydratase/3-hydroxybutyryl-CoA epimerase
MSYKRIKFEINESIAYVGFGFNSTKSMTTLDEESIFELKDIVKELSSKSKDKSIKGVVFHSLVPGCFLAGADINLIASLKNESEGAEGAEAGQKIFNDIEDLKVPTVSAVDGVCFGGGMELALSCNSIICSNDKKTSMGLPEVKLGLIPGFGGTYRMPKRVGLPVALDLILTGKGINARKAKKIGLVDESYSKHRLLEKAPVHFRKKKKNGSIKETIENFASDNFLSKKIIYQKARESVLKKTKGFYQAPLKILQVMEAGMMKSRDSYLSFESEAFGELCISEQSKNLQHIFFMHEQSKKYSGPKSSNDLLVLNRGAAVGAGTMGGGIAWLMADNGMKPIMKDLNLDALELGLKQSSSNFSGALKRRKISKDEFERKQRSIIPQLDFHGFKNVDLIIEAVVENMDIKKKVFSELEKEVRPDCLISSNTSSLSVEEMATAFEIPERFAGLHFFNPVHRMPLVEIITHSKVSPETIEGLYKWCLKVKKTPIIVKDGPGFLVNRILMPWLNEVSFLLEEGVSMKAIDDACLNFGMPMGACRLMDEVGIDVGDKVAKIVHKGLGDRVKASELSSKFIEKGLLGKKTSKGFYLYDEKGKCIEENPEALKLFPNKTKDMDEIEIQMRCFLPMINEASFILGEGIVEKAADVDLGLIFGIGFPPFRGGLLRYADSEGPERLYDALCKFAETVDKDRYTPGEYFKSLVDSKKKFYDI